MLFASMKTSACVERKIASQGVRIMPLSRSKCSRSRTLSMTLLQRCVTTILYECARIILVKTLHIHILTAHQPKRCVTTILYECARIILVKTLHIHILTAHQPKRCVTTILYECARIIFIKTLHVHIFI